MLGGEEKLKKQKISLMKTLPVVFCACRVPSIQTLVAKSMHGYHCMYIWITPACHSLRPQTNAYLNTWIKCKQHALQILEGNFKYCMLCILWASQMLQSTKILATMCISSIKLSSCPINALKQADILLTHHTFEKEWSSFDHCRELSIL